ncbi:MAG: hypothetical protein IT311_01970 [Anaerolineales bacterium]|nr:hypothetical protein [Anaerolineales bacterium]
MKFNNSFAKVLFVAFVALPALACNGANTSSGDAGTPVPANALVLPTNTAVPTNPPVPTRTSTPTASPAPTEDPLYEETLAQVQEFVDEGHIPNTDGEYIELEDFKETFAQMGWYQSFPTDIELEDFVFMGHVEWETAGSTSEISGCGILFAQQDDTSDYAVFLDKSRIFFSSSTPKNYFELGKTRGTGKLNFGNPAEADFSLVVYDYHAYVYVNGKFIGEYTLSKDKPLKGVFGYGIISGINRDFGTRCEITSARVWSLYP